MATNNRQVVYKKISDVQHKLAITGIDKNRKNEHGKYMYRGIEDLQNTLAPILGDTGLILIPSVIDSRHSQTQTSRGNATNHWWVKIAYTFVDSETGEEAGPFVFEGEAYDTSDKGLNKAQTAAFKYFVFQTFCVPVQGSGDADEDHIEAAAPEPVTLLTEDQRHEILGLAMETNSNVNELLRWLGYERMIEVPASEFDRAISALQRKKEKQQQ